MQPASDGQVVLVLNDSRIQRRIRAASAGAVLYDDFGASLSAPASLSLHRRHGAAIYTAVEGEITVGIGGVETVRDRVVAVPPHVWHTVASPGPFVTLLYDPEASSPVAAGTRHRAGAEGACRLEPALVSRLSGAVRANRASLFRGEVLDGLGREAAGWFAYHTEWDRLDVRVAAVAEALRDPAADRRKLVARLGISPAHLRDLFAKEIGLPMRTFQLWHRLMFGMSNIGRWGATTAAHEAGFADLAHFSRTCRAMFGDSPTGLLGKLLVS